MTTQWANRIVGHADVPPDQLLANPLNFRRHPVTQQDALSGVIGEIGFLDPVIATQDGTVIDGHLRVELAMRQNQPTIPVTYVDLTDEEANLALATMDPISAMAFHDAANLKALLDDVSTGDAAVMSMLSELAESAGIVTETAGGLTDPDAVPAVPSEPVTKPGDLWLLGRHRLLCGDATVVTDVERLMGGERADMVFTDPPYAVYGSSTGVDGDVADDKMIRPFFREILTACAMNTKPAAHIYVCCDYRSWSAWWEMAKAVHLAIKNCIVWDKGSIGLGNMYRSQHEFVLFAANSWQHQMQSKSHGIQRTVTGDGNVWQLNRATDKEHNAAKPVELMERAIGNSTNDGDLVLDLFGGSGSTLIACEQTGRRCAMLEIDPHYCDVIVTRWQNFTGLQATRESVAMAAD